MDHYSEALQTFTELLWYTEDNIEDNALVPLTERLIGTWVLMSQHWMIGA